MAKFEVQARVIDLLGIQQIANSPTAVSEIFKNAYDAYACEVRLDVYPAADMAVFWDDGIGMTERDIVERWLLVGAAGKRELQSSSSPPNGMKKRAIQGEKGIGRLAIASLGDTLFLATKTKNAEQGKAGIAALLINWNIIRNEQLRLSDIDVPVVTFSDLEELDHKALSSMIEALRKSVKSPKQAHAWAGLQAQAQQRLILRQLDTLKIDFAALARTAVATSPSGTTFYMAHLRSDFKDYLRRDVEGDDPPQEELVQLLCNFQNSFEKTRGDNFRADIRWWEPKTKQLVSLFSTNETIAREDLRVYDHYMDIRFDEYGRHDGIVELYGKRIELIDKADQAKQDVSCGPFKLRLWYFQGREEESLLDAEQWTLITEKLKHFGGLMIYRDDLRVLPYGRPEFDWLRFEERRSRSASRYFFSYRRMYGYVAISQARNPDLRDKAGREGLIVNKAYRDFRQLLISFFSQLALRHLSKNEQFESEQAAIRDRKRRIEEELKAVAAQRKELRRQAEQKLKYMKTSGPKEIARLVSEVSSRISGSIIVDIAQLAAYSERVLETIDLNARLSVPVSVPLAKEYDLRRIIDDHGDAYAAFVQHLMQARASIQEAIDEWRARAGKVTNRLHDVEQVKETLSRKVWDSYKDFESVVERSSRGVIHSIRRHVDDSVKSMHNLVEFLEGEDHLSSAKANETRIALSAISRQVTEEVQGHRDRLASLLDNYLAGARDQLIAAQTDEIEELREQVDRNLELVQLGLAVEIIDHDLNAAYRGIRSSLGRLKGMVRNAPNASKEVESLGAHFQHLEQRYKLMAPLYRGGYRKRRIVTGEQVVQFCLDFLGERINALGIELVATKKFRSFKLEEVPGVIFPVFVNIVDNSIYWLRAEKKRQIVLDYRNEVVTICDTGPGIPESLLETVFEPFVSTKPGGRGLGLYIARANLSRYGHAIWATNDPLLRTLPGACICIRFSEDIGEV